MSHSFRVRTRDFQSYPRRSLIGYSYSLSGGAPTTLMWPVTMNLVPGKDECYDMTHPGPPYRCGGPFDVWTKRVSSVDLGSFSAEQTTEQGDPVRKYWGQWRPAEGILNASNPSGWLTTWGDVSDYGAKAWNKYKPGKPGADLSQFIGELRDLPRMFRFRLREFKDLGSNYLNYQFGWKPFLNDLLKFLRTTENLSKRLDYFRRNNGKPIKRGGPVGSSSDSYSQTRGGICYPGTLPTMFEVDIPRKPAHMTVTFSTKVWFEGVFQFWIPDFGSPEWLGKFNRRAYGLKLTPSLLWELLPWSWLIDWFSNVGDVMSNLSSDDAADNLTCRYAYVMGTTRLQYEYSDNFSYYYIIRGTEKTMTTANPSFTLSWERKQRVAASPYGFAVTWDGLTPRQLAILAALGITRFHS